MTTASFKPPKTALDVLNKIEFDQALAINDPRYVSTAEARGSQKTLARLARKFGLDINTGQFAPTTSNHVLFFGHIGSGKTTELRHYAKALSGPGKYLVIEVDIALQLDLQNVQYADTLLVMAGALLGAFSKERIEWDAEAFRQLEDWFKARVMSVTTAKDLQAEITTGLEAKTAIPFLLSLVAKTTASFKTNATYKDELRQEIRNNFANFALYFNRLLRDAEKKLAKHGIAKRILFLVDGTDRLRSDDRRAFFVSDVEQLLAIESHVLYTAPLSLKYEGNLNNKLDANLVLPMIKLYCPEGVKQALGWEAMRAILLARADEQLFATSAEMDAIIEASGGHPREMLRILKNCCEVMDGERIDAEVVLEAIKILAADYRRFLTPEDFQILVKVDQQPSHHGNNEATRRLLYNLALLEYNDGSWQRSHPVVRTLEGYRIAQEANAISSAQPVDTPK